MQSCRIEVQTEAGMIDGLHQVESVGQGGDEIALVARRIWLDAKDRPMLLRDHGEVAEEVACDPPRSVSRQRADAAIPRRAKHERSRSQVAAETKDTAQVLVRLAPLLGVGEDSQL